MFRILGDRYALERKLGNGAMGAVYAARNLRTEGRVAIKLLLRGADEDADGYRRFQEEARIGAQLAHPHIVHVLDFDHDERGWPYMVMELLEGQDLRHRLKERGTVPLEEALVICYEIGSALHAAHRRGVVHRDIKPHNIFLARHAMSDRLAEMAKVVDFGIAKIRARALGEGLSEPGTQRGQVVGTPHYMSPEAAQSRLDELDGHADQWGLAVVLYQMLSGRLPFEGPSLPAVLYKVVHEEPMPLEELVPEVPERVSAAIARALCKRPEDRFENINAFVDELTDGEAPGMALSRMRSLGSARTLRAVDPVAPDRRWRMVAAASGAVMVAAFCGVSWSMFSPPRLADASSREAQQAPRLTYGEPPAVAAPGGLPPVVATRIEQEQQPGHAGDGAQPAGMDDRRGEAGGQGQPRADALQRARAPKAPKRPYFGPFLPPR